MLRIVIASLLAPFTAQLAPWAAAAEAYPQKPIRLLVPFAPGGGTDLLCRALQDKLDRALGVSVLIDNRAGAGGTIGVTLAARAAPDGYTFLVTSASYTFAPGLYKNLPYDAINDLKPLSMLTTQQMRAGNLNILHVPYKGAGPSMTDLIGGQIEIVCSSLSAALPHHRQGRVRTLAVMKEERSLGAPEIPTMVEGGVSGVIAYTYNILLAPAGTPQAIIDHLNGAVRKVMADAAFVDTLVKIGVDPITDSNPDKAGEMIRAELAKWTPIIQALGLGADRPTRSASPSK